MSGAAGTAAEALDARVLVSERDAEWVQRQHERIELWEYLA